MSHAGWTSALDLLWHDTDAPSYFLVFLLVCLIGIQNYQWLHNVTYSYLRECSGILIHRHVWKWTWTKILFRWSVSGPNQCKTYFWASVLDDSTRNAHFCIRSFLVCYFHVCVLFNARRIVAKLHSFKQSWKSNFLCLWNPVFMKSHVVSCLWNAKLMGNRCNKYELRQN